MTTSLFEKIESKLTTDSSRWPDRRGEYHADCPFVGCHKHAKRGQTHFSISGNAYYCQVCHEGGSLRKLAEYLSIDLTGIEIDAGQHYDYYDADGLLRYQVVRYHKNGSKTFFTRQPDNKGGWTNSLKEPLVQRIPYRLPQLLEARDRGEIIYITEGEKDVDTLYMHGLTATTNEGGAGKWRAEHSKWLKGSSVVILPDNDDPGKEHAQIVVKSLQGIAANVQIVQLPGLPNKGDVSDWLSAGHSIKELLYIVTDSATSIQQKPLRRATEGDTRHTAPAIEQPAAHIAADVTGAGLGMTDSDNGIRFARQHGHEVKYVYKWDTFFIWDGKRWLGDDGGAVIRRADQTARSIMIEAATAPPATVKEMLAWARQSLNKSRLENMIDMAKPYVSATHNEFDDNPWLLNVENGTIDLKTGKLLPHDPRNLITKIVHTDFNPDAQASIWVSFVNRALGNDDDLIRFVQQYIGYSLTGDVSEQCMTFLYGTGHNGKSTFCETLLLLSSEYAQKMRAETLSAKRDDSGASASPDLARLVGARLVVASEVEAGKRLAESLVKDMTGNDTITARQLYAKAFDFKPTHKLIMYGNHKPIIRGTDNGIWRRIRLVPFAVTIPEAERDPRLAAKLEAELSGILAWAVRGCLDWQAHGLKSPEAVTAATNEYRAEMDVLGLFISESCVQGLSYKTESARLYRAYENWCNTSGEHAMSAKAFGLRLKERGMESTRGTAGKRLWRGIGLADVDHEAPANECVSDSLGGVTRCDTDLGKVSASNLPHGTLLETSHYESRVTTDEADELETLELATSALESTNAVYRTPWKSPTNVNARLAMQQQQQDEELAQVAESESGAND